MKKFLCLLLSCYFLLFASLSFADRVIIYMSLIGKTGPSNAIGIVTARDTKYGLLLTPQLSNLPAGIHGFHLHNNPSCANSGKSAGDHFDPKYTAKHLGPYDDKGHLGDLPVLMVDQNNKATVPVLAPRLKVADIKGLSLVITLLGDNYGNKPEKDGGGGALLACGVIR